MQSESPRMWRRMKYSPTILPIILAALLTAITVQPAGDQLSAQRSPSSHAFLRYFLLRICFTFTHTPRRNEMYCHPMERHVNSSGGDTCGTTSESCCFSDLDRQGEHDADMSFYWNQVNQEGYPMSCLLKYFSIAKHERSLLSNADAVALIVRTTFILLEFGSRPLKNAKKILSCGYTLKKSKYGVLMLVLDSSVFGCIVTVLERPISLQTCRDYRFICLAAHQIANGSEMTRCSCSLHLAFLQKMRGLLFFSSLFDSLSRLI